MNRRNFVVGLGTVATISGVASVTAAAFSGDDVSPTTNFQIIPEDAQLVVRRLEENVDYADKVANNASWVGSEITDFANITGDEGSPVVAHINESENGQLGAQLAFNNTNESGSGDDTYDQYTVGNDGFFEIANLGDTDEDVAIEFTYSDRVGSGITEEEVANAFEFTDELGERICPDSDDTTAPLNEVNIASGTVQTIGLRLRISDTLYNEIQEEAGGAFSETEGSIRLLESITVGVDSDNVRNPN